MIERLLAPLLTPFRLRLYPVAMLGAVALGFVLFVAQAHGAASGAGRVGSDLPAFYAAGRMVNEGKVSSLYHLPSQLAAQADLIPDGGLVPFAYPPFAAAAYAPLARLPYVPAYVVHTLVMVGLVALALWRLVAGLPRLRPYLPSAVAAAILFHPLGRAIFGGQNTALSVLLVCGAYTARTDLGRGLWLGLWLWKPQLALPVLGVVALRRPKVLLGAIPPALGFWSWGALLAGPGWVSWWLREGARPFIALDRTVNQSWSVSLYDLGYRLAGAPVGYALQLAVAVAVAYFGFKRSAIAIPLVAAAAPLISPHALYYDAGIALLALFVATNAFGRARLGTIALVWAAAYVQLLPGPWTVPVCLAAMVLVYRSADPETMPPVLAPSAM